MDKKTKSLKAVADLYGLPVDLVGETLENLRTKYLRTMRELTKPPRHIKINNCDLEKAMPPLPGGLKWPQEQFETSPEFQKRGGICRHLERVWKPLILKGVVDMPILREFYPSTAKAIDSYKSRGVLRNGIPCSLPSDIDVPLGKPGSGRTKVNAGLQTLAA